ncbi:hypothetical protein [Nocardia brasiliensis]|uniref:hypothetical protein n=1 Tax=Nocardia brasiliensis TaxID=37326 RepID=UPI0024560360|nr:hypothetical protein [Nocardia brasiliensis]
MLRRKTSDKNDQVPGPDAADYQHDILGVLEDIRDDLRAIRNHLETQENQR